MVKATQLLNTLQALTLHRCSDWIIYYNIFSYGLYICLTLFVLISSFISKYNMHTHKHIYQNNISSENASIKWYASS